MNPWVIGTTYLTGLTILIALLVRSSVRRERREQTTICEICGSVDGSVTLQNNGAREAVHVHRLQNGARVCQSCRRVIGAMAVSL